VTDRLEKLEAELRRLRPAALDEKLAARIDAEFDRPVAPSWSDRLLISAMSGGAIAACTIIAIILSESSASVPAAVNIATVAPPPVRAGDATMIFAQADNAWWKRSEVNR
jgi:hypothetical protein